jgi:hypothetical protein
MGCRANGGDRPRKWADWSFVPVLKGKKNYSHNPVYTRNPTTSYKGQLLKINFTSNPNTDPKLKKEIDNIMKFSALGRMRSTLILTLLSSLVASSAVAAGDAPEEVIRALYKAHRPWEHKELNLGNRAVLSRYFSPELTKLFLKNAQLERDCPKGDLCGLDFDPILGAQDFDDHLNFKLRITEVTPPQTGRFEARFKLFNEEKPEQDQILIFQLVQLKNGWRIDDIIYTKDNSSLKAVLTAILDEAAHLKE